MKRFGIILTLTNLNLKYFQVEGLAKGKRSVTIVTHGVLKEYRTPLKP